MPEPQPKATLEIVLVELKNIQRRLDDLKDSFKAQTIQCRTDMNETFERIRSLETTWAKKKGADEILAEQNRQKPGYQIAWGNWAGAVIALIALAIAFMGKTRW